jgi:hypothetical protein
MAIRREVGVAQFQSEIEGNTKKKTSVTEVKASINMHLVHPEQKQVTLLRNAAKVKS